MLIQRILFFICFFYIQQAFSEENNFINYLEKKQWSKAENVANPSLKVFSSWMKLIKEPQPDCKLAIEFVDKHGNWPKTEIIINKIENCDFSGFNKSFIQQWFNDHPPETLNGLKIFYNVLSDDNLKKYYLKKIFVNSQLSNKEALLLLEDKKNLVDAYDILERINNLITSRNNHSAIELLNFLPKTLRSDIRALIEIDNELNYLVNINRDQDDDYLIQILKDLAKHKYVSQSIYWKQKHKFIRPLIAKGDYDTAYQFAISHGFTKGSDFCDAEWLAGWIALRFLNNPAKASYHFKKFLANVKLPISKARGAYWLARSFDVAKNKTKSEYWYQKAAANFETFYGQLAACKVHNCIIGMPNKVKITAQDQAKFNHHPFVQIIKTIDKTNLAYLQKDFLVQAIKNTSSAGEISLFANLAKNIGKPALTMEIAKQASYQNVYLMDLLFPSNQNINKNHQLEDSLVNALIKQESQFDPRAESSAGALGLMQIMPKVAQETAKKMGIKFIKNKLLDDVRYNTLLATTHFQEVINKFDRYEVLSIAAYNAGSQNVENWIKNNGDPREFNDIEQVIDWIEKISFYETRNYVQRVLEAKEIYQALKKKNNQVKSMKGLLQN